MPNPPHAFSPYLNLFDTFGEDVSDSPRNSQAYLASRNDASPLIVAAQTNDLALVNNLLSEPDILTHVSATGLQGETALHMAAALGYVDVAKALLSAGASPNAQDIEGQTSLTHCARFCPAEVASEMATVLLSSGADPAQRVTLDLTPVTPLFFAIDQHKSELAHVLEPLTPRDLDVFPPGIGRNYITDITISSADRHEDTTILEWILIQRQLLDPLRKTDHLGRAARDETFTVLVRLLDMGTEDVKKAGTEILRAVWTIDRRRIVACLRRLVVQYHVDVNDTDVKEFVFSSRWPELIKAAQGMGLNNTVVPS